MVIMVEGLNKVGEEEISEGAEVEEIILQEEVQFNQVGKSSIMMI